jgi:hypothetical protein
VCIFVLINKLISEFKLDKASEHQWVDWGTLKANQIYELLWFIIEIVKNIRGVPDFIPGFFMKFKSDVSHQNIDSYAADSSFGMTS